MTIEQLMMLNCKENYVTDGVNVYSVEYVIKCHGGPIEFTFTNIESGVMNDLILIMGSCKRILQNPMKIRFLQTLSIKPKKEEPKMKTDFTMQPQTKPNTYPSFMLNKTKGYIVLFFRDGCGVVVSGCNDYEVNHFSTSWLMELFTPVEGCSVTFSDKD